MRQRAARHTARRHVCRPSATRGHEPRMERAVAEGSTVVGQCDPAEKIEAVVMLRRQDEQQFEQLVRRIASGAPGAAPISRDELEKRFGASPADVATLKAFA